MADVALVDRVIASHYAEPVARHVGRATTLRLGPAEDSQAMGELTAGEPFAMLDDSVGWAWGYAGEKRRVGYVPSGALRA